MNVNVTPQERKILELFVKQVCINFKQWCKDNGTNLNRELKTNGTPGRVTQGTIYDIIAGRKNYLPLVAMAYLASKTNLTLAELAKYKSNAINSEG